MNNDNSKLFLLVLLGLLTAFGPFVTDMYLPTLPAMTDFFRTSSSMVQMGLTTSMIGLAAGQLLFGPLSDKYGRRTPLLTAMWLFIGSTLLCIFASDIRQFIAARFLQGIAGSGGIVISRSVATDRFGGRDLARMLALIGAVNGVAPVVAPIIGGTLTDSIGWQGIFCILLGLGCLLLAGCFRLRESLPAERRSAVAWNDILRNFGTVLRNRRYLAYVLQMGFAQGVLFAYIASSPFIVQGHYGFSAFEFSICFAVNAVAIGGAAAFSIRFRSPERSTRTGCAGMLLFAAAEAAALGLGCGFWVYEGVLFGLLFVMGLTFTSSTALAGIGPRARRHGLGPAGRRLLLVRRHRIAVGRHRRHASLHRCGLRRLRPLFMAQPAHRPAAHDARRRLTKKRNAPARNPIVRHAYLRTLTMILRTVPSPTIGAWPSSGKSTVNWPGRSV